MNLILQPKIKPMAPSSVDSFPRGDKFQYEPKWDGFRCVTFKDGDTITLQSKEGSSFNSRFPEVAQAFAELKIPQIVLDGELMVFKENSGCFSELLRRNGSEDRKIAKLARTTPASFVAFDLLVTPKNEAIYKAPFRERRNALEALAKMHFKNSSHLGISLETKDIDIAKRWLETAGATNDGVVIKALDTPYTFGKTSSALKIKPMRVINCVIGGITYSGEGIITTLHLGVYNPKKLLDFVGSARVPSESRTLEFTKLIEQIGGGEGFTGRTPTSGQRAGKETRAWHPVKPIIVAQVKFRHFSGGHFTKRAKLVRIHNELDPSSCTWEQLGSDYAAK